MQNQNKNINLDEAINEIKRFQKILNNAASNTDDVKTGKCTTDDEKQEPSFIIYNAIAENSINILQQPDVVELFKSISTKLDETISKSLVELIAVAMTQSAYNAILLYDDLLSKSLTDQFNDYNQIINKLAATVSGCNGALEVFKSRIGELETRVNTNN